MNREWLKKIVRPFTGQTWQQSFYEKLYLVSLVGMNYAIGGDLKFSGEYTTIKYVKSKLKKSKPVLFDVGANLGDYSLALAEVFERESPVIHCFEPSPSTILKIRKNVTNERISIHNFGFSDQEGEVTLYQSEDTETDLSGNASVYQRNRENIGLALNKKEVIQLTTLDLFCEKNGISEIDFLKMDVEGHEFNVLKGAEKWIKNDKIKFIQFEFGGTNIDSRTYFKDFYDLLSDKYRFYRILANGLKPITEYNEMFEIFTTINFLVEHKSIN